MNLKWDHFIPPLFLAPGGLHYMIEEDNHEYQEHTEFFEHKGASAWIFSDVPCSFRLRSRYLFVQ